MNAKLSQKKVLAKLRHENILIIPTRYFLLVKTKKSTCELASSTTGTLFFCCVCVVNDRRRALLLVLLCDLGTLHAKKVTELLHKQQHT